MFDPDHHPAAVDVADLECRDLGHPQPGAVGRGQCRSTSQTRNRLEKARDLLRAQHHRQLLRLLGADDAIKRLLPAERHPEEEAQRARHLVDVRPRQTKTGQMNLVGADLLHSKLIRGLIEKATELRDRIDVGLLSCWREIANRHVVEHAPTQRGRLSHHGISCLDDWGLDTAILSDRSLLSRSSLLLSRSGFVESPLSLRHGRA